MRCIVAALFSIQAMGMQSISFLNSLICAPAQEHAIFSTNSCFGPRDSAGTYCEFCKELLSSSWVMFIGVAINSVLIRGLCLTPEGGGEVPPEPDGDGLEPNAFSLWNLRVLEG